MFRYLLSLLLTTLFVGVLLTNPTPVSGQSNSYVSVVNPVRGNEFWPLKGQQPADAVLAQSKILRDSNIPATWLIRFDALSDGQTIGVLKQVPADDERGLFLEVTPGWAAFAGVNYNRSNNWHDAGSVFLTGYSQRDRRQLIDSAFVAFKEKFGYYPKSVGSWWIDAYSLNYMKDKYGITAALIVADQFSTDNYQIWGQYFGVPYYPSKINTLFPAAASGEKLDVVITQWAARDPVNGYGNGVFESTYSVQANDYTDYHGLDTDYFRKLVDIYTKPGLNQFGQLTIGLENSYDFKRYGPEYKNQIEEIAKRSRQGLLRAVTMAQFSRWYQSRFPGVSPEHVLVSPDPLGSGKRVVWFMNPYYRAGWFYNQDGSVFRDIRQYVGGEKEPCFDKPCQSLNLAVAATRVLDDVTYGKKWVLDSGKISSFNISKSGENYLLSYQNEAGNLKRVEFMGRDLAVDGKVSTIDGAIMNALSGQSDSKQNPLAVSAGNAGGYRSSLWQLVFGTLKFLLFLSLVIVVPGTVLLVAARRSYPVLFLSLCLGAAAATLFAFFSLYLNLGFLLWFYPVLFLGIFMKKKLYNTFDLKLMVEAIRKNKLPATLILAGTFFQSTVTLKSGWVYDFGVGFWGPNGHDGVWHQALVNQLMEKVPPVNPALSGETLKNYHYFYDLLVAVSAKLTGIPVTDLIYRFYPVLFSLLLGVGTYHLATKLFKQIGIDNKSAVLISIFFVYFGSSFGWVVEYLRERHFGGESAFWANQPVSANLNPPFAISLVLFIGFLLLLLDSQQVKNVRLGLLMVLLGGVLIEFKVYAGVILLAALSVVALQRLVLHKEWFLAKVFLGCLMLSLLVFLPQNSGSTTFLVLAPFWFIHSMVDFPDRVGWLKLAQAREAYFARGEWLKYVYTEGLGLMMFIFGNLGTRLIAVFSVLAFVKNRLWRKTPFSFLFWSAVISLSIPIFFIQKGNPWNTIQFMYYTLFVAALFSGPALVYLYKALPKSLGLTLTGAILLITPVSSFTTFQSYFGKTPAAYLSVAELQGLTYLKSLPDGVVLTKPFDKTLRPRYSDPYPLFVYDSTSYVSAFSAKQVFVADEAQQDILQNDYQKRIVGADDFFNGWNVERQKRFLREGNIKYIFLVKADGFSPDLSKLGLEKVFENAEVEVLEVR